MNLKKIEEVIRLMEKHNLSEITIEEEGVKIHLQKDSGGRIERIVHASSPVLTPVAEKPESPAGDEAKHYVEIKAPMVGTLYMAPSPDAKPFVAIGSIIKEGDVLCIIEAMKLMNEIKSEVKGKVVDIPVENAEPVEFGQVMFLVEPK